MYRPTQHFEGGWPEDRQADAAMMAWACSEPRQDLEPEPPALQSRGFLGGGDAEADHFREIAEDRRARHDDSREVARCER